HHVTSLESDLNCHILNTPPQGIFLLHLHHFARPPPGISVPNHTIRSQASRVVMPIWFLNLSNATLCNGFVIPSAIISAVGMYVTLSFPCSSRSRMKW